MVCMVTFVIQVIRLARMNYHGSNTGLHGYFATHYQYIMETFRGMSMNYQQHPLKYLAGGVCLTAQTNGATLWHR